MAIEQQWEYCQLYLEEQRYDKGKNAWYYDLRIRYFGPQGGHYTLSESHSKAAKAWEYNPWHWAIGLLGLAGWEMVHVQHGVFILNMGGGGQLLPGNSVAYFKRPVLAGRGVREPELQLP